MYFEIVLAVATVIVCVLEWATTLPVDEEDDPDNNQMFWEGGF